MIKILKVSPGAGSSVALVFSDGSCGEFDLTPLIARQTPLTSPLTDTAFRDSCFLELGALCWPNGLELSAASIHEKLRESGKLKAPDKAA